MLPAIQSAMLRMLAGARTRYRVHYRIDCPVCTECENRVHYLFDRCAPEYGREQTRVRPDSETTDPRTRFSVARYLAAHAINLTGTNSSSGSYVGLKCLPASGVA